MESLRRWRGLWHRQEVAIAATKGRGGLPWQREEAMSLRSTLRFAGPVFFLVGVVLLMGPQSRVGLIAMGLGLIIFVVWLILGRRIGSRASRKAERERGDDMEYRIKDRLL